MSRVVAELWPALLLALWVGWAARAQAGDAASGAVDATSTAADQADTLQIVGRPLARGGRLVVVQDPGVPLVTLTVAVPAGHLSSGFTRKHELAWTVQRRSSDPALERALSAFTDGADLWVTDTTCWLRVRVARAELEHLGGTLRLLFGSDYGGGTFDATGRLRQAWRDAGRSPSFQLRRAVAFALRRPGDPVRQATEAPEPLVAHASELQRLRLHLLRHPDRVVGLAGDIDVDEAERLADRLLPPVTRDTAAFGPLAAGAIVEAEERRTPTEARLPGITQSWVAWAREGLTADDPDAVAVLLTDMVLVRRLQSQLRAVEGVTYTVSSDELLHAVRGAYRVYVPTRDDRLVAVSEAVRDAIALLGREGVTADELARVKAQLEARTLLEVQAPDQVLLRVVRHALHGDPTLLWSEARKRVVALDVDTVNIAAARFWDLDAFTRVWVRPKG